MAKLRDTRNNCTKIFLAIILEKGRAYLFYSKHLIKANGTKLINNFFVRHCLMCNFSIVNLEKLEH